MPDPARKERQPLYIAYHALMAIGAVQVSAFSKIWSFARCQEIANDALRLLNVEHTKAVQEALGIGGSSKQRGATTREK